MRALECEGARAVITVCNCMQRDDRKDEKERVESAVCWSVTHFFKVAASNAMKERESSRKMFKYGIAGARQEGAAYIP